MFEVESYGRVRRAVLVDGKSQRAVAREFGLSRDTVFPFSKESLPPAGIRLRSLVLTGIHWLPLVPAGFHHSPSDSPTSQSVAVPSVWGKVEFAIDPVLIANSAIASTKAALEFNPVRR